jgi:hypothetical protein
MPNFGEHAFCAIRDTRAALLLLAADHGPLQAALPSTVLKRNTSRFVFADLYRVTELPVGPRGGQLLRTAYLCAVR